MRAVVLTGHGGPDKLQVQERPDPEAGPGQVRIAVKAAGINFADLMARTGVYPDAPPTPCVLGYEVAGQIESVGEGVEGLAPGDRVLAGTRFGGQAELVAVDAGQVIPMPERVSFEQGAAFPVNYGTAYAALVVMGGLREGDRLLIHAAAGGVGIAAIQIARQIGAETFGTASAAKHDAVLTAGLDHAIDYRALDFEEEVRRLTNGEGVDVIIDATGPTNFRKDYRLLRQGGRMIMFGLSQVQTGERRNIPRVLKGLVQMPLSTIPWWKSLALMNENKGIFGLNMLSWWDREGSLERLTGPMVDWLADGTLDPVVSEAFPYNEAADAHRYLGEAKNIGKVVLVPR